jgi:predicted DNA-binding protein
MNRERKFTAQIVTRVTAEQVAELKALADAGGRTIAQEVRLAVRQHIERSRTA